VGIVIDNKTENRPGLYLHYSYFDACRLEGKGLTSYFLVEPGQGGDDAALAQRIDANFSEESMRGATQTTSLQVHMRQFTARLFDFGRAIGFVSNCICLLLAILLAANLYVITQKNLADYQTFYRLGFSRRWVIVTAFSQLTSYIVSGVLLSILMGIAIERFIVWLPVAVPGEISLHLADYMRLLAVGVALTVICTAPALIRLIRGGFSQ